MAREATPDSVWQATLEAHSRTSGRLLFRVAYRVLGDVEAAEDACQQTFAKAWQHRASLRDDGALRAWLVRVALNDALALRRRRHVERRALAEHAVRQTAPPGHETLVERRELVLTLLEKLEEPTRSIVALRTMEGLSGNEVKAMLGCSASEVSRRLHQGLDQLRGWMRDRDMGPGA